MKKGFTLIELLSILIILAIISIIIIPVVNESIDKSRQRSYDSQVRIIEEKAEQWAIYNSNLLPSNENVYKLPLSTLISENYIDNVKNGKLKNPKDSDNPMDGCVYISFSVEYNQYVYQYKEEC